MLSEIVSYMQRTKEGESVDSEKLSNMLANLNDPFDQPDLNNSPTSLQDRLFQDDLPFFQELFNNLDITSHDVEQFSTMAQPGIAGLINRTGGSFYLIDQNGKAYSEIIEIGLMHSVFYYQIVAKLLSDAGTGDAVENTVLVEGKNYTLMEHSWDEAYGYLGFPINFPGESDVLPPSDDRFWAAYADDLNSLLSVNQPLKDSYTRGRAAIAARMYEIKNEERSNIIYLHELISAATTVHYLNQAIADISIENYGELMYHMSMSYAFVRGFSFSPSAALSASEINLILNTHFGNNGNFWLTSEDGLQLAKSMIINAYPELETIADQL